MNKLTTIITILFIFAFSLISCGSNPPEKTALNDCAWTDPVKVSGDGTGEMLYDVTHTPAECDVCGLAPLYGGIEIVDGAYLISIDGNLIAGVAGEGTFLYEYMIPSSDCVTLLTMIFIFPDEPEDYEIGDTWTFSLE